MSEDLYFEPIKIPKNIVDDLINTLSDLGYKAQILEDEKELYIIWRSDDGHYYCATDYFPFNSRKPNAIAIGYLYNDDIIFDFQTKLPIDKKKIISTMEESNKEINETYSADDITKFLSNSDTYFQMWKQRCFVERKSKEAKYLEKTLKSLGYTPERLDSGGRLYVAWKTNFGIYIVAGIYDWTVGIHAKTYSKVNLFSLYLLNNLECKYSLNFIEGMHYPANIDNVKEGIALTEFDYKEFCGSFCPINKQDKAYEKWKKKSKLKVIDD